jgi:hypothetical protein
MDVGIVEAVLANIAAQMAGVVQALVPLGTALAGSFLVLSILLLGLNLIVGGSFTPAIVRSMGAAAATFWAIQQWPDLVMGTLTASRDIIGLFIGGYGGPTDLFQAAAEVTARVMVEPAGWSWSVSGAVSALAQHFLISLATVFIAIGLAMPGIMAILAELSLLLGAAAAPLILPALAFPVTAPLGWGAVNFMVAASLRVVVMGLISVLFGDAITAVIDKPGPDEVLTFSALMGLLLTALLSIVASLSANSIAGSLVGGGLGSMGWTSARGAAAFAAGSIAGTGAVLQPAVRVGASATAAAGGAAISGAKSAARGVANVTRSIGNGSAFGG